MMTSRPHPTRRWRIKHSTIFSADMREFRILRLESFSKNHTETEAKGKHHAGHSLSS